MKKLTGGQAAVEALKAERTEFVFGLIGSATMEMFDALYDAQEIKLIGVHDERTGTHMADGYARASGNAGVVLAGQNGPGTTNLVTGLAQAKAAYTHRFNRGGAGDGACVPRRFSGSGSAGAVHADHQKDMDRHKYGQSSRNGT